MTEQTQFLVWARHELIDWQKGREHRDCYLLPYLSLESLKKDPHKLFALLHARTQFSPQEWILVDAKYTGLGWFEGRLAVQYSNCTISLLSSNYGQIVPWTANEAHRWDSSAFPRAKIILEAQFVLMGFLRKLVNSLVEDLQGESNCLNWIRLADTGFRGAFGSESWSAFTNKAFANPTFQFDRYLDLAKSKHAEAVDHLWLLQTDAAYMLNHIQTCFQNHICFAKDATSKRSARNHIVPLFAWINPIKEAVRWGFVVEELEHAKTLYERFRDSIHVGQNIPRKFDFAMACLELLLVNHAQFRVEEVKSLLSQLDAFQSWFTPVWINGKLHVSLPERVKGRFDICYHEDPMFWCLWALGNNFEVDDLMNPAILINFLDEQLGKETTGIKTRLEPRLLDFISSHAALHEILTAVRQFRPMCSSTSSKEALPKSLDRASWRKWKLRNPKGRKLATGHLTLL